MYESWLYVNEMYSRSIRGVCGNLKFCSSQYKYPTINPLLQLSL